MAYYEIIFGSGFYECYRYVMQTEEPTTDYGALIDVLIDYLVEQNHGNVVDWDEYEWREDEDIIYEIANPNCEYNNDMFVVGGNAGNILFHYGTFYINEITEDEIRDAEIVEV